MRAIFYTFLILFFSVAHADEATESVTPPTPVKREPARIPSAREAEAMNSAEKRKSGDFGFFIGADGSLGKDIFFNNVTFIENGSSNTGSASMNSNLAAGALIGIEMMPYYSLGFQATVEVQTPRPVSSINHNVSNVSIGNTAGTNSTLQFNLIEASGIYRWNQYYGIAGLNYSIPVASNFGISTSNYSFSGFIGGQLGAGAIFYDQLHVEILFYMTGLHMSASGTDFGGTPYTENFGYGYLYSGEIRAHWTF